MRGNSDESHLSKLRPRTTYSLKAALLKLARQQGVLSRQKRLINQIIIERQKI